MLDPGPLIDRCLALHPDVRYVAVYSNGTLQSRERSGVPDASTTESDRYEELLVNPTVLTLARQRGNIDCGGLRYVVIRYGNFFQFVSPVVGGHISVAIEPTADILALVEMLQRELGQ